MAYDESIYRRRDLDDPEAADTARLPGAGYDEEPTLHDDPTSRPRSGYSTGRFAVVPPSPARATDRPPRRAVSPATLDNVFDDPNHGEPGRDRMAVHVVWEVLLLAGAAALAFLLYREDPDIVRGTRLDALLLSGAVFGLLALGSSTALRTGAPNLVLGPVMIATALHFAENGDRGLVTALWPAAVAAVAVGLLVAIVVVAFHVPSWAVSLAAGLAIVIFIQRRSAPVDPQGGYDPTGQARYLFGGFAAATVLAGLFGSIRAVRRLVGRFRAVSDPADRRGGVAGTVVVLSIAGSTVLAMLAGALRTAGSQDPVSPTPGFEWTGLALGMALLGGTSAFGRRGGVFGTLLSVILVTLFVTYAEVRDWSVSLYAIAAGAILVGLVVTRLVEAFGRPRSALDEEEGEWDPDPPDENPVWRRRDDADGSWSSTLPGRSAETGSDPWRTDPWRATDR